ncbi:MAG: fumarylacetoacetate hydrolase family protein [Bacteroides stercoris]|jgi:fumarylpyruvate hydrolase|uniref:FAA hydrolase family protein n=1 Tax=Bacteroides stercoris TaxID=46506 RepID=A0A413E3N5_BACSE|nr:fumarylacetoacetate hydrolase family protein [Bacteroides stercoris]RGW98375.1 FAA hydrolase family protein [Bacteroides stercoris]
MKIIAVGMNYAQHNKELGHTQENSEPVIFMKPDSAILKDGKPFFVPDFSHEVHYETEVVVRICRLGKNIAPRFAHRYYDAVTVGIDFTARDLQRKFREAGNPWELCKGFDNSAAIGTFISLEQAGGDLQNLDFHLDIDGCEVQRGNTADMLFKIDDIIAYVSRFMTLKIGDLLFTGTPAGVGPVSVGQHLQGYLGGEKLLDFHIR